ncbi:MAG TPA: Gfo/Idh/MocA family oxidoreductase [Acidimicrobiales bacterium]|nr:Gfo/Idh/MocA family oxidoreductase [Acidimicrobiales bacterium]
MSGAAGPVRWGVIGATAKIARHAVLPALAATSSCRLVAVASESSPAGGYADFGAERVLSSYEAVLADPEVEAVYIPLPNSLHAEWTIRAAGAGKHVLCEKPLASTALEAVAMAAACDQAGVLLFEAYMTPFHPRSERLETILRSGRLGDLRFARTAFTGVLRDASNHRWSPAMGGGALLDVGIYCLAPLLLAAGRSPVKLAASSVLTESGVDSSFSGWLDFGRGFVANFECSFETPERQSIEVVGTEGSLTMERTFTPGLEDTVLSVLDRSGAVDTIECGGADPYAGMVDHVSAVVRGTAVPRRTPADAIEVATLIDRLRTVADGGA